MGDPDLCPVVHLARAVKRVRKFVPDANKKTPLCTVSIKGRKSNFITQEFTLRLLKDTCEEWGGAEKFGFSKDEIGNKSIRSGAAMALFLRNHSSDKIMILGRWKSKAWLEYIRPQVLQLIDLVSEDMVSFENFYELVYPPRKEKRKRTETKGVDLEIPGLLERPYDPRSKNGRLLVSVYTDSRSSTGAKFRARKKPKSQN